MKLNQFQIDWIVSEYRADRTIEEIAIDTGKSQATVKRALAEAGEINLSWHKSAEQHKMLEYLHLNGIKKLDQLVEVL